MTHETTLTVTSVARTNGNSVEVCAETYGASWGDVTRLSFLYGQHLAPRIGETIKVTIEVPDVKP